jgi:hypothetical protein
MFLDEWLRKLLSGGGAQGSPMPSYRDFVTPDIHHTRPADMPPMLSYTPGRVTKGGYDAAGHETAKERWEWLEAQKIKKQERMSKLRMMGKNLAPASGSTGQPRAVPEGRSPVQFTGGPPPVDELGMYSHQPRKRIQSIVNLGTSR